MTDIGFGGESHSARRLLDSFARRGRSFHTKQGLANFMTPRCGSNRRGAKRPFTRLVVVLYGSAPEITSSHVIGVASTYCTTQHCDMKIILALPHGRGLRVSVRSSHQMGMLRCCGRCYTGLSSVFPLSRPARRSRRRRRSRGADTTSTKVYRIKGFV